MIYRHAIAAARMNSAIAGVNAGRYFEHPDVRADLTYFETPTGGAVFATSSIAWSGSLSHSGYDNDVSRITANVLNRFIDADG